LLIFGGSRATFASYASSQRGYRKLDAEPAAQVKEHLAVTGGTPIILDLY
jgi:hypothetical protein